MSQTPSTPSLHTRIAGMLREQISQQPPGTKLASEAQLAQRFKVSVFTVREALSLLAAQGLVERRPRSGTYVSERSPSRWVAVLSGLDVTHPRTSYFFRRLAHRLRVELESRGLAARLYVGRSFPGSNPPDISGDLLCPEFWEDVAAGKLDGVVSMSLPESGGWCDRLEQSGLWCFPRAGRFEVRHDYAGLVREGVAALRAAGCQRLAVIGWPHATQASGSDLVEVEAELRQQIRPAWFKHQAKLGVRGAGWDALMEAWTASSEKPDGLLVCDDVLFEEAAQALFALGVQVPEEVRVASHAVVGNDGLIPFPMLRLEFHADEHARLLASHLAEALSGCEPEHRIITLPCQRVQVRQRLATVPAQP